MNASFTRTDQSTNLSEVMFSLVPRFVIVFLVLFGNILVIVVISKTMIFHSYCNFLLLNLCVSDLVVGIGWLSPTVLSLLLKENQKLRENISMKILSLGLLSSLCTVVVISWERYRGITKPIQVRTEQKTLRLKLVLSLIWFCAVVGSLANSWSYQMFSTTNKTLNESVKDWNQHSINNDKNKTTGWKKIHTSFLLTLLCFLPMSILCYSYIRTVCLLWSQKKNVASNRHQSLIKSRERITKLLGIVIVAFTFTSLPYSGTIVVFSFLGKEEETYKPLWEILGNLLVCGSFINPLLYWFHNRKFRQVAKRISRCKA